MYVGAKYGYFLKLVQFFDDRYAIKWVPDLEEADILDSDQLEVILGVEKHVEFLPVRVEEGERVIESNPTLVNHGVSDVEVRIYLPIWHEFRRALDHEFNREFQLNMDFYVDGLIYGLFKVGDQVGGWQVSSIERWVDREANSFILIHEGSLALRFNWEIEELFGPDENPSKKVRITSDKKTVTFTLVD